MAAWRASGSALVGQQSTHARANPRSTVLLTQPWWKRILEARLTSRPSFYIWAASTSVDKMAADASLPHEDTAWAGTARDGSDQRHENTRQLGASIKCCASLDYSSASIHVKSIKMIIDHLCRHPRLAMHFTNKPSEALYSYHLPGGPNTTHHLPSWMQGSIASRDLIRHATNLFIWPLVYTNGFRAPRLSILDNTLHDFQCQATENLSSPPSRARDPLQPLMSLSPSSGPPTTAMSASTSSLWPLDWLTTRTASAFAVKDQSRIRDER